MGIADFLSPNHTVINIRAPDKARLLNELCNRAASILNLDADGISAEILKREELGSTGIGGGVAIPHARVAQLDKPFGILARLKRAIDFNAIDSQPVDVVFLLLLPTSAPAEQLNALAAVARMLRDTKTMLELHHAPDGASLYHAVVAAA